MTIECSLPDATLGVAVRVAIFLDCQSRALGENGFQALARGPAMTATLSGLIAIFVALIGYRLLFGATPSVRDGVHWAVRVGVVLTLVTSWPAFQTLVYRVVTDGPEEFADVLLPASGLPNGNLEERVQAAYDVMRLDRGAAAGRASITSQPNREPAAGASSPAAVDGSGPGLGFEPLPLTASLLVATTIGLSGALRLAVGFLIAVAPLGAMALLFNATLGLFTGWVRALSGSALAVLACSLAAPIEMAAVESEVSRIISAPGAPTSPAGHDPQALVTIIVLFFFVTLIMIYAAFRMTNAVRLGWAAGVSRDDKQSSIRNPVTNLMPPSMTAAVRGEVAAPGLSRADVIADAVATAARRDRAFHENVGSAAAPARRVIASPGSSTADGNMIVPLGVVGHRSAARRTRSASRRDKAG